MKKFMIIGFSILSIGIIFLLVGLLVNYPSNHASKPSPNQKEENIYKDAEVIVFDYQIKESLEDIKISFTLYNNSDMTFEDTSLFVEYYDEKEKVYRGEIHLGKFEPGEEREITDESFVFLYDKLTDYKFYFIGKEVPVTTKDKYIQEYGSLTANYNECRYRYE